MDAELPDPDIDVGTPGASARREHERRRANREQRVRDRHHKIGGVLLALSHAPAHEKVWAQGAGGEEMVARSLAKHLAEGVVLLHDRRIPRSRSNIDHIAVASSGVWVIDAKRYKGKVHVANPLFGTAKLTIGGRDKSRLADGLVKQVSVVEDALRSFAPDVPVHGAMCFIDAEMPLIGNLSFRGFALLYPKRLAKRINADGPIAEDRVRPLAHAVAGAFPTA